MPISNEEAIAVLPPGDSFLRDYMIYAIECGQEASYAFHLGVGLSILSASVPEDMEVFYTYLTRPQLYTLLVGPSGDGKSSALNRGIDLISAAAPKRTGKGIGSAEGLFDSLAYQNQQIISVSEWGEFLSKAKKGYFETVKATLTACYDGFPMSRTKAKTKQNENYKDIVEKPRLSLLAGCSIPFLEQHTLEEDWTGGFMGRFLIFYGVSKDLDPWPNPDFTGRPKLIQALKDRVEFTGPVGKCLGPDFSNESGKFWNNWYRDIRTRNFPSQVAGLDRRATTFAAKIAMLLHWDCGHVGSSDWHFDLELMKCAISIAELHVRSVIELTSTIAVNEDARMIREVVRSIEELGGEATKQQIMARLKRRHRVVNELIDTCLQQGTIRMVSTPDGEVYRRIR